MNVEKTLNFPKPGGFLTKQNFLKPDSVLTALRLHAM